MFASLLHYRTALLVMIFTVFSSSEAARKSAISDKRPICHIFRRHWYPHRAWRPGASDTDDWYTVVWPLKDVRPGALCLVFKKDKLFSIVSFEKSIFPHCQAPRNVLIWFTFLLSIILHISLTAFKRFRMRFLLNQTYLSKICAFVKAAKLSNYQILVT